MANFTQYWSKRNDLHCLYYVCGEEVALREVVLTTIKRVASAAPIDSYSLDGASTKIAEIMDVLTREPVTSRKFVLLRNGQRVKDFGRILEWVKQIASFSDVCFVVQTDEVKPVTTEPKFRPFVEQGCFVECKSLTKSKLYEWLRSTVKLTQAGFDELVEICGWELVRVLNEAKKLSYLDVEEVDKADVLLHCHRTYDERFVDKLMLGDKRAAGDALSLVTVKEFGKIIGLLDYKLTLLNRIGSLRRQGLGLKDVVSRLMVPFYAVQIHWDLSQSMSSGDIRRRLSILVGVDSIHRAGNKGCLEVLLAQW